MAATAYIGLGANLGQPHAMLHGAIAELERRLGPVLAVSPFYDTAPRYDTAQPEFLNAVVACAVQDGPGEVLQQLLEIEAAFGRTRDPQRPKGPRTLDLDLLLHGEACIETPTLVLPHPAMAERRFVLQPLADIAPDLIHPRLGVTITSLLASCKDTAPVAAAMARHDGPPTEIIPRYHDQASQSP